MVTSPATTPTSSSPSASPTSLSLAASAAPAPWAMMLGTLASTAASLVSASSAALKPSMASEAQALSPAADSSPPTPVSAAPNFSTWAAPPRKPCRTFRENPMTDWETFRMDFSWSLVITPASRMGRVNWSCSFSRILTFLLGTGHRLPHFGLSLLLQLPGNAEKQLFGRGKGEQLLQAVAPIQVVGDEAQLLIARDQFFTSSLASAPSP